MAISAKFVADFSQWKAAVQGAQGELAKLTTSTDTAGRSLQKLTDEQAGRMTVTTAEIKKAGIATGDWGKELGKFDSILASFGVNVSTQVKALQEMRSAAGASATQLGLLGTAGLAAGAALAGWQIGRLIADLTGLDQKVAETARQLLGLADPALETAAAKQDVLDRATKNAGRTITDYAEAIRINQKAHEDWILVSGRSKDAAQESADAVNSWRAEIGAVYARGDIKALNADLESQNFSLQELSKRYGVHVEALQYWQREQRKTAEAEKARAKESAEAMAAIKKAADDLAAAQKAMWDQSLKLNQANNEELRKTSALYLEVTNAAVTAELAARQALAARRGQTLAGGPASAEGSLEGMTAEYERQLAELRAGATPGFSIAAQEQLLWEEFQDNFNKAAQSAGELAGAQTGAAGDTETAGNQAQSAGGAFRQAGTQAAAAGLQFQGAAQQLGSFMTQWGAGAQRTVESQLRNMNAMFAEYTRAGVPVFGGLVPGSRQAGGPVSAGSPYLVGEAGPELFVPATSGAIVPRGAGAITVNVTIEGSVLSSTEQIAAAMSEAMIRAYRQGGNRIPV
jgi:hypothetical protein